MQDIVIPVHNALVYLKKCVESVYANTKDFRLIIVDDFSTEPLCSEYCDYLAGFYPHNLLVRHGRQRWFTRSANSGLRLSRGENVVLLNSDTLCCAGWLEELFAVRGDYLKEHPGSKVGLVGAFWSEDVNLPRYIETKEPNYATGHCLLLNREAMEHVAYNRGTAGWWFNELDYHQIHISSDRICCYDLNKAGYATLVAYQSHVEHHGGKSWGYDLGTVGALKLEDVD